MSSTENEESGPRESRQVSGRGLVIQEKGAGYDLDLGYEERILSLLEAMKPGIVLEDE